MKWVTGMSHSRARRPSPILCLLSGHRKEQLCPTMKFCLPKVHSNGAKQTWIESSHAVSLNPPFLPEVVSVKCFVTDTETERVPTFPLTAPDSSGWRHAPLSTQDSRR